MPATVAGNPLTGSYSTNASDSKLLSTISIHIENTSNIRRAAKNIKMLQELSTSTVPGATTDVSPNAAAMPPCEATANPGNYTYTQAIALGSLSQNRMRKAGHATTTPSP